MKPMPARTMRCWFSISISLKSANDEFGHLFGDRNYADVAHLIQANVRKSDISAHVGGDEFLIFMEYRDHLEQMIERIFQALNGSFQGYDIAVSMGVACFPRTVWII